MQTEVKPQKKILSYLFRLLLVLWFWVYHILNGIIFEFSFQNYFSLPRKLKWLFNYEYVYIILVLLLFFIILNKRDFFTSIFVAFIFPFYVPLLPLIKFFMSDTRRLEFKARKFPNYITLIIVLIFNNTKHAPLRILLSILFLISAYQILHTTNSAVLFASSIYLLIYLITHIFYRLYLSLSKAPIVNNIEEYLANYEESKVDYYDKNTLQGLAFLGLLYSKFKDSLKTISNKKYLFLVFGIKLIVTVAITIIALSLLHYAQYKLAPSNYYSEDFSLLNFVFLSINTLVDRENRIIEIIGIVPSYLETLGGVLQILIGVVFLTILYADFKEYYSGSVKIMHDGLFREEQKLSNIINNKYNITLEKAIENIAAIPNIKDIIPGEADEFIEVRICLNKGKYTKAIEILKKFNQEKGKSAKSMYLLGYSYGELGQIDNMISTFNESTSLSPQFEKEINQTFEYYWGHHFNNGVAFFNKASKYNKFKYFEIAVKEFKIAIKLLPESSESYKNLTFTYINMGRQDLAIEPLQKLIELDDSADAYSMLGEIYIAQGHELMDSFEATKNVLKKTQAEKKFNKAVSILEKGREKYSENGDILLYLSNAYINANKLEPALDTFKAGVQKDPQNKYYRYNYGVLLLESEEFELAEKQFSKAIEIDTNYSNAIYNLAATYVKWGSKLYDQDDNTYIEKFEMAIPHLKTYLKLNLDDYEMWELLGKIYANIGEEEKSNEAFQKSKEKIV